MLSAENMKSGQNITLPLNKNDEYPLISVIVLTYKKQKNIFKTLDTILMQSYPCIELIVSDDASGEQDKEKIENYITANKASNIIGVSIVVNDINLGTVAHSNKVIGYCRGEYIKFMPCGDGFVNQNSLIELFEFINVKNMIIATSKSIVCSEDFSNEYYEFPDDRRVKLINESNPKKLYSILACTNIISAVGTIFRADLFETSSFDEKYRYLEDLPLWLKLTRGNIGIPCMGKATVYYSLGGISSQTGNAHNSNILKTDIIRCYENEILQNIQCVNFLKEYVILYRYKKLKYYDSLTKCEKIIFNIKYAPLEAYFILKTIAKEAIVRSKG